MIVYENKGTDDDDDDDNEDVYDDVNDE